MYHNHVQMLSLFNVLLHVFLMVLLTLRAFLYCLTSVCSHCVIAQSAGVVPSVRILCIIGLHILHTRFGYFHLLFWHCLSLYVTTAEAGHCGCPAV